MNPQPNTPTNFNYNPNMGNNYSSQNMQVPMTPEQYAAWYNQQLQMMQQMQYGQPMYPQAPTMQTPMNSGMQVPQQGYAQMPQQYAPQGMNVGMQPQAQQPVSPVANQPMMVNGELNPAMMQRDPNVLAFMAQAVKEKYKDQQVTDEFMQTEANRLYDDFGNNLVSHFEPMLTEEQLKQFDELLQNGSTQDQLLQYLMSCIPDLTKKIEDVLISYKEKYLMSF